MRVINKNIADDDHKIEVIWYNVLIIQQNIIYIPIGWMDGCIALKNSRLWQVWKKFQAPQPN
jgi:hypothetical protein